MTKGERTNEIMASDSTLTHESPLDLKDLTPQQQSYLMKQAAQGFHLTPQMVKNITSEITFNPMIDMALKDWVSLGVTLTDTSGKLFPVIQVNNPMLENVGMKEENLDFEKLAESRDFKLSVNRPKGFLSLATHGNHPWVKEELRRDEIEWYAAAFFVKYLLQREDSWRYKKRGLPKQMYLPKGFRKKMKFIFCKLQEIKREQRLQKKLSTHRVTIYG